MDIQVFKTYTCWTSCACLEQIKAAISWSTRSVSFFKGVTPAFGIMNEVWLFRRREVTAPYATVLCAMVSFSTFLGDSLVLGSTVLDKLFFVLGYVFDHA